MKGSPTHQPCEDFQMNTPKMPEPDRTPLSTARTKSEDMELLAAAAEAGITNIGWFVDAQLDTTSDKGRTTA